MIIIFFDYIPELKNILVYLHKNYAIESYKGGAC